MCSVGERTEVPFGPVAKRARCLIGSDAGVRASSGSVVAAA
jgi:hypothetical protein